MKVFPAIICTYTCLNLSPVQTKNPLTGWNELYKRNRMTVLKLSATTSNRTRYEADARSKLWKKKGNDRKLSSGKQTPLVWSELQIPSLIIDHDRSILQNLFMLYIMCFYSCIWWFYASFSKHCLLKGVGIFQPFDKSFAVRKDLHCHLERRTLIFCIGDSHANRSTVIISTIENGKELKLTNILNICNHYKGLSGKKCGQHTDKEEREESREDLKWWLGCSDTTPLLGERENIQRNVFENRQLGTFDGTNVY